MKPSRAAMSGGVSPGLLSCHRRLRTLANRADIRLKDLILKVDGRDVTSPEDLERYVRETDRTSVVLDLLRDNLPQRIEMSLE